MELTVFKSDINNPSDLIEEFFAYTTELGFGAGAGVSASEGQSSSSASGENEIDVENEIGERKRFDGFEEKIRFAWDFLLEKCGGKPDRYLHPLRVALILAQNNLDADTMVSAILHTTPNYGVTVDELKGKFGEAVGGIVAGAARIGFFSVSGATIHQADAIRKMMFALSDDVRIILLKLADRLDKMRNLKSYENQTQRAIAEEVIEIWAPLADRLGMQSEKNELEDLSLKYTNPDVFQQIKAIVAQKQDERAAYLKSAVEKIRVRAEKHGIKIYSISSRAKHFYSIYQKMRKRNTEAGELFDLLALRVICDTTVECYALIGIVHDLWKPLEGRFKDYIANPKANGYQSLHTTVMCEGRPLEIQIRTAEMHNMAEHGIASHWLYKKGTNKDLVTESQLDIFNQLQELKKENFADTSYYAELKNEILKDEIYVFTPKGDVIHLPQGANAIDFAYAIHSKVGEKISGAKADGKIIALDVPLKNTQIVEILTNPNAHPTENQLKIAKTSKARQKIHSWLTLNNADYLGERKTPDENAPKRIHHRPKNPDIANRGAGNSTAGESGADFSKGVSSDETSSGTSSKKRDFGKPRIENIRIGNTSNFLFSFAKCCNPKYPDSIVAYLSRTKGMTIHRADCYVYNRLSHREERSLAVEWADDFEDGR